MRVGAISTCSPTGRAASTTSMYSVMAFSDRTRSSTVSESVITFALAPRSVATPIATT